jgi:hypothetical protein
VTAGERSWLLRGLVLALALLAIGGAVLGDPRDALWVVVVTALFPIISAVLQSGIERLLPAAGPRKSPREWLLHLQVNSFFAFARIGFTVAAFRRSTSTGTTLSSFRCGT